MLDAVGKIPFNHMLKGIVGFAFVATIAYPLVAPAVGIEVTAAARAIVTVAGALIGGIVGART